jgi:hypothetical protein
MRNIFDQYSQPENRLTHALASVLYQDSGLLKSFLAEFGPKRRPSVKGLKVIEQSLPGQPEAEEVERESQGLPDALIYDDDDEGWALIIESKVMDSLIRNQLMRHQRTIERCGFERVSGLAITMKIPRFAVDGWRMVSWKDVYIWAGGHKRDSQWAGFLIDYFNVAEARMIASEYLKGGTITEFSGIDFDPFTYLEGKRVLRLLAEKLRDNAAFIREMRLDPETKRSSITDQSRLWDFISFKSLQSSSPKFDKFPHCTISVGPDDAEAMITFPHRMPAALRKATHGHSAEEFTERLAATSEAVIKVLKSLKHFRPIVRIQQRRYKSQSAMPVRDALSEFDLRTIYAGYDPVLGRAVKQQAQWAEMTYELLANKRSNLQFQIGVNFDYARGNELACKDADKYFTAAFIALRSFAAPVID